MKDKQEYYPEFGPDGIELGGLDGKIGNNYLPGHVMVLQFHYYWNIWKW